MKTKPNAVSVPVLTGPRPRVLIIEARFYQDIADDLLKGARAVLEAAKADVQVVTVPGALEIPGVLAMALRAAHEVRGFIPFDGFVALGCVIRGETTHYEIVSEQSNQALMYLIQRDGVALGNGILTVENAEQARERADPARLDKGGGAARACLDMIGVQRLFGLEPIPPNPFDMFEDDPEPDISSMLDDIVRQSGATSGKKKPRK